MSRIAAAGVLILALCLPVSVGALGRSTVDPNAGKPKSAVEAPSSSDVAQKVTYEARRKTVVAILEDLSKMTGVTLKAGYNVEDWQVRDRRMNIFARDIPLANLMDSIARVMKFQWSKTEKDNGIVSYRLYMDRKALLGAERQRYVEEEKLKKHQAEARQKFLSGLEAAAEMSEEDLEKLKTQSPYIYTLAKVGWADSLPGLFAKVPIAKQAWFSGEVLNLDISSLPPDAQQGLAATWKKTLSRYFGGGAPESLLSKLSEGRIAINAGHMTRGFNKDATVIGDVKIDLPGYIAQSFFDDPDSASGKLEGSAFVKVREASTSEEKTRIINEANAGMAAARAAEARDLGEPVTEHPDDPVLSAKVKMNVQGKDFADTLSALAKSSSFAVVSDGFEKTFPNLSFPPQETTVRAVLGKVESECRYNWEKHGSVMEFHDRDWFRKRAAQIPEAWLMAWRTSLKETGSLDIGELSKIAMLTGEQFWTNILSDEVLGQGWLAFSITANQEILCFYAGLARQQQAAVFTSQGLSLDVPIGSQSVAVQAVLRRCSALRVDYPGELRLVGVRGADPVYTLSAIASSGDPGVQWKIACGIPTEVKKKK